MAEGATVANAFVQIMPSMEGATSNISNALIPGMKSAGDSAGSQFSSVFSGKAGAALKMAGGALAGVFAVGAMKDAFETVEAGFNNVKIATGATGEQAEALKQVYLDVSKSVTGSFEDIGSAVGEINTRLGLEGEELEKASEQMMKYAKVTGQDATKATQDVASMMRNVGIPANEMGSTLDKLTKAGQAAGIDVSNLATNVTKYNAVMKEMGFTTDEQIALMSQFEVSGADTNSVLSAMKKGVANWAKEGKDAGEEFRKFVQGVQDGTVTSGDAVEIFGSKGGLSLYEAAQKGQLSFDEMYRVITEDSEGALDSVYQSTLTAQEKFDILGKNLQAGFFTILEPIVDALMPFVDQAITALTELINGAVEAITPFVEEFSANIAPIMEQVLPELQSVFNEVMTAISDIVKEVWPFISELISTAMQVISSVMKEVWPMVRTLITTVLNAVKNIVHNVWPDIQNTIQNVMNAIKGVIDTVWPIITGIIETAMNIIQNVIETVWPIISDIIITASNVIAEFIKTAWPVISDVIETVSNIIANITENVWPVVERIIKDVSSGIEYFTSEIWPKISGFVEDASDKINEAIDRVKPIVDTIKEVFEDVREFIEDPLGKAKEFIDDTIRDIENAFSWMNIKIPEPSVPEINYTWQEVQYGDGGYMSYPDFYVSWYAKGGFSKEPTLNGYGEKGLELYWPGYAPYFDMYAKGIAEHMPNSGVDIHDCTFNVRKDSDIRAVAVELNTLINRQTVGAIA